MPPKLAQIFAGESETISKPTVTFKGKGADMQATFNFKGMDDEQQRALGGQAKIASDKAAMEHARSMGYIKDNMKPETQKNRAKAFRQGWNEGVVAAQRSRNEAEGLTRGGRAKGTKGKAKRSTRTPKAGQTRASARRGQSRAGRTGRRARAQTNQSTRAGRNRQARTGERPSGGTTPQGLAGARGASPSPTGTRSAARTAARAQRGEAALRAARGT